MADDGEEMYLENLDEFVNDEDKIVTYKWLSRTLSVNANRAKQMLYKFINHQKISRPDSKLNVTYLVGGQNQQNGEIVQRYVVTGEQELQETKKQFTTVTSVHIYSVAKCRLKDSNPLYSVDYSIQQEHKHTTNRWNHIHCKAAEKIRDSRSHKSVVKSVRKQPQTQIVTNGFHDPSVSENIGETIKKEQTNHKSVPSSKKPGRSTASSMKSFFAQCGTASKTTTEKAVKTDANNKAVTKAKDENHKAEGKINKIIENEPKKRRVSSSASSDEEDPLPKKISNSVVAIKETKLNKNKKTRESGSKNTEKGAASQRARRKFKAMVNDSDDDNEVEKEEVKPKKKRKRMKEILQEESGEESPTAEKSPEVDRDSDSSTSIPNQQPLIENSAVTRKRKRTKVMRSKTYMNDNGFMVTEKVWESDSTDASDVETEEKQNSKVELKAQANQDKAIALQDLDDKSRKQKSHKPATATNKPVKQSNLMSFFKKT